MKVSKKHNKQDDMQSNYSNKNKYIDLKVNGRLFPTWTLANFKHYMLPEIIKKDDNDPCFAQTKLELQKYQTFMSKYLDFNSPYKNILIYHNLGSGKTASAINIYNALYTYTPGWNVFILVKAANEKHPWIPELKKWLPKDEYDFRMKNIIFVHYDAPNADKAFMNAVKSVDASKKSLYIIDEVHNFIRNVYGNISSTSGRRAQSIYDYIIQEKKENNTVRVVLLSATPAINVPFELALLFNLLRPGTFPMIENDFNHIYVGSSSYKTINLTHKNMFQRRILGLVTYYIGATPDLFATKSLHYIDLKMSKYQQEIYAFYEDIEETIAKKKKFRKNKGQDMYKLKPYTRQASNFVFPHINQHITGESRPRPNKFRISTKDSNNVVEGKSVKKDDKIFTNVEKYMEAMNSFADAFDKFLFAKREDDEKNKHTLNMDIKNFMEKYKQGVTVENFLQGTISTELQMMATCSIKMVNIALRILISPGPVFVYSNYVLMEGIQIFKIYLKNFNFNHYKNRPLDYHAYVEYHGSVSQEERAQGIVNFNKLENIKGKQIKVILVSPAGTEGLSLENVRQVHIMEPYWHEVRITQTIGRALRYCSHKHLPKKDRHVDIYRYKVIRDKKWTTDQNIEDGARTKDSLIQSFLDTIKESAVDCVLNQNHNMLGQEFKCFQFEEQTLFDQQIGPAYKKDIYDDMKISNGSNSLNSLTVRIKAIKISAVMKLSDDEKNLKYSKPKDYWFYEKSGIVYDYDLKYPIGKVAFDEFEIPIKLDENTYIIDRLIPIPLINEK